MKVKLGINGFGRIGRYVLRAAHSSAYRDRVEVVRINDLAPVAQVAHLLKYDSVHGRLPYAVQSADDCLTVDNKRIAYSSCPEPQAIDWQGVDIVLECSGVFRKRAQAELHLRAGAKKVIISAPAVDEDITVVYGVNSDQLDPSKHVIISNASCTTNCLAPPLLALHQRLGVSNALMTTVHSYTGDQRILDLPHKDLRRSRAAAANIIPTSTGAARAIGLVIPALKGKVEGIAVRVPTPNVSLVDVVMKVEKDTSAAEVNAMLKERAAGDMQGIMTCCEEELVSSDFIGNPASSIVDLPSTTVMDKRLVKVMTWYDNEAGFSYRMLDVARQLHS
ncbi:MAG: type I glyceraldehyde-3-phosphate dehydrogenase [Pseudomonadota bacterium]|nr:type I glyceraldehyde-3-phosphate dehydrogenase [Pseudomonadota bacterium]